MKITPLSTPQTNFIEILLSVADRIHRFSELEVLEGLTLLQFNILGELRHATNPKVGDIKKHLIASSASLSQTLKRMERDGLIVRILSNSDKRVIHVHITDKGKRIYDISNERYIGIAEKRLSFIDSDTLKKITSTLETLDQDLEKSLLAKKNKKKGPKAS